MQLNTIRRNGAGATQVDPIAEALAVSRQIASQKIIDRNITDLDAERLKSENAKLSAEIEREKLLASKQGSTESDGFRDFILSQLDKVNSQLADTQRVLSEQQAAAMQDRINILSTELERLQASRAEQPSNVSAMRQAVDDARALMEIVTPAAAPPPLARTEDPAARAWELRARLDHEIKMKQLDAEERRRDKDAADRIALEREKIQIERDRSEQMMRFFNDTSPRLLEMGQQVITLFIQKAPAGTPGVAAAGQIPPQSAALPEGASTFPCEQCGAPVAFRPGWERAGCLACGAEYSLKPDAPAAPANGASPETHAAEDRRQPEEATIRGFDIH